jgi:hypothetical protein
MTAVEDNKKNYDACICEGCPTFPGGDDPILYCAKGKSSKDIDEVSCLCPGCPVWADHALDDQYYCEQGAAE